MSILDLQLRHRELGRLRLGAKGPKGNPIKLDTWRFTSSSVELIQAVAEMWGGEWAHWGEHKFEVITDIKAIPVRIPAQLPDPEYQLWSAGGLQRRCNGVVAYVAAGGDGMLEQPCICLNEDERSCKPHTRFEFILPDIPDIGIWALTSTGFNAASELTSSVRMLAGTSIEAQLAIEHRETKRPGQPTHKFVVAVLTTRISMRSLLEAGGVPIGGDDSSFVVAPVTPALPLSEPEVLPSERGAVGVLVSDDSDGDTSAEITHISEGRRLPQEIAETVQEQAWVSLLAELEFSPDGTMDENETALRTLFNRMEAVGLWGESDRTLHAALAKDGLSHVRDMNAAPLREFCKRAFAAAKEAVANSED